MNMTPQHQVPYKVIGKLNDRSGLSDEMAELCANQPIYLVRRGDLDQSDTADKVKDQSDDADQMSDAAANPCKFFFL